MARYIFSEPGLVSSGGMVYRSKLEDCPALHRTPLLCRYGTMKGSFGLWAGFSISHWIRFSWWSVRMPRGPPYFPRLWSARGYTEPPPKSVLAVIWRSARSLSTVGFRLASALPRELLFVLTAGSLEELDGGFWVHRSNSARSVGVGPSHGLAGMI
jgi:hypothetical protein